MELNWQKPELTPVVETGDEQLFWVAIEANRVNPHKQRNAVETCVVTFLAYYQNRPLEVDDDGEYLNDDYLVDTNGDPLESCVVTFLAYYQNRPLEVDDDGEYLNDDYLVDTNGDPLESIGWVDCKVHYEFDNFYEPLDFNENYKLLGWAEYTPPVFTSIK